MTEEQMEKLSDMIVDKIMEMQKQYDKDFIEQLETANVPVEVRQKMSDEERIMMDIASLVIKMKSFEEKDEFEKAMIVNEKISVLRNKLKKYKK